MPATPDTAALPNERTVEIMRIIDAPRTLVFRMWIEPAHMAQWWGPKGFDNPSVNSTHAPAARF